MNKFAFMHLFIISNENGSISFAKIKNFGFLRGKREPTYTLNDKYQIYFGNISGAPDDFTDEEIKDITNFVKNNEECIQKILESNTIEDKSKYIEELV